MKPRAIAFVWALIAGFFYVTTMARDLTWAHGGADGGDLITAAWVGGVPHPSGYPLWTTIASVFLWLPLGTPAWRAGLISVLSGAVAVGATTRAAARLLPPTVTPFWYQALLSLVAASVMVSPLLWGQSLIVEVYALHAGLLALALDGLLAWHIGGTARGLQRFALAWGLALANHLTALWLLPSIILLLWKRLPPKPTILHTCALLNIGPLFYLTIPLRAISIPIINWGGAYTLDGMRWLVSGEIYRQFLFALPTEELGSRVMSLLGIASQQFGPLGFMLSIWGLSSLWSRDRRLTTALTLFLCTNILYATPYNTSDSYLYLLPNSFVFALGLAYALALLPDELQSMPQIAHREHIWAAVIAILIPIITMVRFGPDIVQWNTPPATLYVRRSIEALPQGAIVFATTDEHIFAMWYVAYVVAPEQHITVIVEGLLPYEWYRESLRVNHPALRWPANQDDIALGLLESNISWSPIYTTAKNNPIAATLTQEATGPLWHIKNEGGR